MRAIASGLPGPDRQRRPDNDFALWFWRAGASRRPAAGEQRATANYPKHRAFAILTAWAAKAENPPRGGGPFFFAGGFFSK